MTWYPVVGFEDRYKFNLKGEVFSVIKGRKMWISHGGGGYPQVRLCVNSKYITKTIHRIIAEYFVPNPNKKPWVNHKDGNKLNFSPSNLEWCTPSENHLHAYKNGLKTPWNKGRTFVDRERICEGCKTTFEYDRPHRRFCSRHCANNRFKQGVLKPHGGENDV